MISAVSMARGMTLAISTWARTRSVAARWSRSASAWRRPSGVSPAQPVWPAIGPWNPALASPWRTRIRRIGSGAPGSGARDQVPARRATTGAMASMASGWTTM